MLNRPGATSAVLLIVGTLGAVACRDALSPASHASLATHLEAAMVEAGVPFHVDYVIEPRLVLPGDAAFPERCPTGPNQVASVATGAGQAAHMGQVSETESNCINFATLSLTQGQLTLTAASGDRVDADFEGSASLDPPPPNADLACTWTITGGTGRFDGATGAGSCVDSRQLGDGRSHIVLDGWIRYEAGNAE